MPVKKAEKDIVEAVKKTIDERAPMRAERDRKLSEEDARWSREIAALESRVYTEAMEIDLGNGASIAIRTCLTGIEGKKLDTLEQQERTEKDPEKRADIAAEMISLITLNPLITKEWIIDNQDKYSPSDILRVLLGFMEVRVKERTDRIKRIQAASYFLPLQGGN